MKFFAWSEKKTFRSPANSFKKNLVKREKEEKKKLYLRPEDLLDHEHGPLSRHLVHERFLTQLCERRHVDLKKLKNT